MAFSERRNRLEQDLARRKSALAAAEGGDEEERAFLEKRLEQIGEYPGALRHVVDLLAGQDRVTPATIKKIRIS